jgi:hypothetical protein
MATRTIWSGHGLALEILGRLQLPKVLTGQRPYTSITDSATLVHPH